MYYTIAAECQTDFRTGQAAYKCGSSPGRRLQFRLAARRTVARLDQNGPLARQEASPLPSRIRPPPVPPCAPSPTARSPVRSRSSVSTVCTKIGRNPYLRLRSSWEQVLLNSAFKRRPVGPNPYPASRKAARDIGRNLLLGTDAEPDQLLMLAAPRRWRCICARAPPRCSIFLPPRDIGSPTEGLKSGLRFLFSCEFFALGAFGNGLGLPLPDQQDRPSQAGRVRS